jgi:uncharacterized protein YodC (DUF2158 family)
MKKTGPLLGLGEAFYNSHPLTGEMMDIHEISAGDVVILKTGGPKMTIERIDDKTARVSCVWFSTKETIRRDTFPPEALDKVEQ